VRTYSVVGLEVVPEVAREHGLKVMLGAWIGVDEAVNAREVEGLVELANRHRDTVSAVIVGNEVLLRREMTGAQVAALVRQVKSRVAQPVTYADVWEFWRKHPEVGPAVDFVTIHLLPYWEDEPHGIDAALGEVREVRELMGRTFPGRTILIGETGWPSEGRQRETAVPSRVNQARFVRGFVRMAEAKGWRYNLIEAFDQPWKRDKEGAVGGYWGLFTTDRVDKGVLTGAVSNLPGWRGWLAVSLALAVPLLVAGGRPGGSRGALAPPVATAGATLAAYHLHYGSVAARSLAESTWVGAEALLSLAATLLVLLTLAAPARGWRARLRAALSSSGPAILLGVGFCAAVGMLQLAFEPRYRDFPFWIYLVPALGLLWLRVRGEVRARAEAPVLGALVALGAPAVLAQETLANAPALAWVGVSLVLAGALLWSQRPMGRSLPSEGCR
jgi:exo-beta-1,3-glucanase (GH17 family)